MAANDHLANFYSPGYDDKCRMFLVWNSWSPKWGIDGYCWIAYDYLASLDLAADFRIIQAVASK